MLIQSLLMFLLAVLYDFEFPNDDGTCAAYDTELSCLERRSLFDSSKSYCQWTPSTSTSPTNEVCSYAPFEMTYFEEFVFTVILASVVLIIC